MKMSPTKKLCIMTIAGIIAVAACRTGPPEIPEELTSAEFFQRAQEAVDQENWDHALAYYVEFLERYPDDLQNVVAAEYEIAFIYYRRGERTIARERLNALLARYDEPGSERLPDWPAVLAERILEIMDESEAAQTSS